MDRTLSYLACPYSHEDKNVMQRRFDAVTVCAAHLVRRGKIVYSPITHSHPMHVSGVELGGDWKFWRDFDLAYLQFAKELLILPLSGWKDSVGVSAELAAAKELNLPIVFVDRFGYPTWPSDLPDGKLPAEEATVPVAEVAEVAELVNPTIREMFAAFAAAGLCAHNGKPYESAEIANVAVDVADELLLALAKKQ